MAGKVSCWLYEKRSLKKPKLGPSDVYPQEPRQKEVFSSKQCPIFNNAYYYD